MSSQLYAAFAGLFDDRGDPLSTWIVHSTNRRLRHQRMLDHSHPRRLKCPFDHPTEPRGFRDWPDYRMGRDAALDKPRRSRTRGSNAPLHGAHRPIAVVAVGGDGCGDRAVLGEQTFGSLWLQPFRWRSIAWGLLFAVVDYAVLFPAGERVRRTMAYRDSLRERKKKCHFRALPGVCRHRGRRSGGNVVSGFTVTGSLP